MATAYITEYNTFGVQQGNVSSAAFEPAVADQTVSFTTATQSAAFNDDTKFIRLIADANCNLAFGANPTATASTQFVPANTEVWRGVAAGHKVSVYDGSS